MSRLPYLRRDDLDPDAQQVWDSVVGSRGDLLVNEQGGLAGPFNAFVHVPRVGRRLASLGQVLRFGTTVAAATSSPASFWAIRPPKE